MRNQTCTIKAVHVATFVSDEELALDAVREIASRLDDAVWIDSLARAAGPRVGVIVDGEGTLVGLRKEVRP